MGINDLVKEIKGKLTHHHELYRFPVKAELWEDIFDQVINPNSDKWEGGGHSVGADVIAENDLRYGIFPKGSRIQNKSGSINLKNQTIKWNGHRTTSHKTIEEKVDFISQSHYDFYVMLGRVKKEWDQGKKVYHLIIFDSDKIDYSKLKWEEKMSKDNSKVTGWKGIGELPYSADITISTSHQLWTTANLNYLGTSYRIEI